MKRKLLAALTACAFVSSCMAQVATASTTPNTLTQDSAVKQLISVFNKVPSWPKNLQVWSMAPGNTGGVWSGPKSSYPPTQWIGLGCVFPGDQPRQYAKDLGITETSPSGSVTANQLAQWIVAWEIKARHVGLSWQPSKDPYTLLSLFSFFYGTNIKGPNSVVTQSEMYAIRNNIIEVSRGWRMLAANKVQMLSPLVAGGDNSVTGAFRFMVHIHQYKMSDWPSVYGTIVRTINSQTYTAEANGDIVYQYQHGTGFTPGTGAAFVNAKDDAYSSYSWTTSLELLNNPAKWKQIFDEPTPEVFIPTQHLKNYHDGSLGFTAPSAGQVACISGTEIWSPYVAKMTQPVFFGLSFEFLYKGGRFQSIRQVNTASYNYPSEVFYYA